MTWRIDLGFQMKKTWIRTAMVAAQLKRNLNYVCLGRKKVIAYNEYVSLADLYVATTHPSLSLLSGAT